MFCGCSTFLWHPSRAAISVFISPVACGLVFGVWFGVGGEYRSTVVVEVNNEFGPEAAGRDHQHGLSTGEYILGGQI